MNNERFNMKIYKHVGNYILCRLHAIYDLKRLKADTNTIPIIVSAVAMHATVNFM
jgi:hypothetical protein